MIDIHLWPAVASSFLTDFVPPSSDDNKTILMAECDYVLSLEGPAGIDLAEAKRLAKSIQKTLAAL